MQTQNNESFSSIVSEQLEFLWGDFQGYGWMKR